MVSNSFFGQLMEEKDNPGFFKILRKKTDLSSVTMRMIPHHLIRSISEFSYKMVLKVAWGSTWQVKISKNPYFYYMEDLGWNKFVSDNFLGQDEYLTFTHEANMCFNVDIYEPNGKEMLKPRKAATIASSSGQNKRDQLKNRDVKEEDIESLSESSYPGPKTAESLGARLKKKQKKVEEAETSKKKKVDTEANTWSHVPEFTRTITKSYLLFLGIPKEFVDKHMPDETMMFKIHHWKGKKSWEVKYVFTDIQSRFSAGWIGLAREFGLVVGDVCNFKLIKPNEMLLEVTQKKTP